jgi:Arc/MetJ family transcription regulator
MMTHMRTTVDLPDELLREVQQVARAEGTTMRSLMEEGLRAMLARHLAAARFSLRDASVPGEGVSAQYADATWAQLREAAYGDRL